MLNYFGGEAQLPAYISVNVAETSPNTDAEREFNDEGSAELVSNSILHVYRKLKKTEQEKTSKFIKKKTKFIKSKKYLHREN